MQENGIQVDAVAGTSAGSIVAALYGMGYTTDEMYKLFNYFAKSVMAISPKYLFSGIKEVRGIKLGGITSSYNIESAIMEAGKLKQIKNIKDIKVPISIPTTDLITDREIIFTNCETLQGEEYIHDIEIGKAVRASSSFPAVFNPCLLKNHAFMDGGTLDNVPVNEVKKQGADKVIAVKFDADKIDENSNIMDIIMKTIDIMGSKISEESLEMSDLVLNVYTDKVGLLDVEKLDSCYKYGYECVMENIDKIKEICKEQ